MFILYFYIVKFIRETLVKLGPDEDDMLEEDFFSSAFGRDFFPQKCFTW